MIFASGFVSFSTPKAVKIHLGPFLGERYLLGYDTKRNHFSFLCTAILKHIRSEFIDAELGLLLIKYSLKSSAALLTNRQIHLHCVRIWLGGDLWGVSVFSIIFLYYV